MKSLLEMNDEIKNYPCPIAGIYKKYLSIAPDKYNDKHSLLCDMFESLIKFNAIIAVKEAIIIDKKIKERFPKGLDFLKHPSLGHWVSVIRELSVESWEDQDSWLYKISLWFNNEKPDKTILENYNELPEINFQKGSSATSGIANSLVTYRNKVWKGHGAGILSDESLKKRIPALEFLLSYLLEQAVFLKGMNLFYSETVNKLDKNKYEAKGVSLLGTDLTFSSYIFTEFEPKEIYLGYSNNNEFLRAPLILSPLLAFEDSTNGIKQFYFFNDAKRTKLEYLSYIDSSFYYHKEVTQELQKIFNVDLEKASEDYEFIVYNHTEEERTEKSNYYYQKGLELFTKGNLEGAIITFEDALEWYRRPEIIVKICEAMYELGDDQTYILNVLESAFELDPNNLKALELKDEINNVSDKKEEIEEEEFNYRSKHYTYLDIFLPDKLKNLSMIFWVFTLLSFYGISAGILILINKDNYMLHLMISISSFFLTSVMVISMSIFKNNFIDAYFPLLGQLSNWRIERFNKWFNKKYNNLFGDFIIPEKENTNKTKKEPNNKFLKMLYQFFERSVKINKKDKFEKYFIIFSIIFLVTFGINTINIQKLYDYSFITATVRFFETFIMWLFIVPSIRFIIVSTITIKEYSDFETNPVISRTNINGFQALNKVFIQTLIIFNLFWVGVWIWNLLVVNDPYYFDFLGLLFGLIIVIFWMIFTPLFITRAINFSKSKAISDYDNHLKVAFNKFLKSPENNTAERVDWLMQNEIRIKNLSTKLFDYKHWIILILSYVIVLTVTVLYVLLRIEFITINDIVTFLSLDNIL